MFGFVVGTACLLGLVRVLAGGRAGRWSRCGGWRHAGGDGPRAVIRSIFERLDTTPGQEKAVKVALDELRAAARTARDTLNAARASIAATMREESFDEVALGGAAAQLDEAAAVVRKAAISAFATVHGALESHQRRKLADLIAHGGPFSAEWPEPGRNRYTL